MPAVVLGSDVADNGLAELAEADALYVCSQQPATYYEATNTYALGNAALSFGAPEAATGGRKVVSDPISGGEITASGDVSHWAAVDTGGSRLLAAGAVDAPETVTDGQSFMLAAITINAPSALGSTGPQLLLDNYPNAAFGLSFRRLRRNYSGSAVRIRRSSDDAEADIGFIGDDFDTAAAATHIGGGSGYIVKWYDQSGNGVDVSKAVAGNQPTYVADAVNSKPSILFVPGSNTNIGNGTYVNASITQGSVMSVVRQVTGAGQGSLFSMGSLIVWTRYGDDFYLDWSGTGGNARSNATAAAGWLDNNHILQFYRDADDNQGIAQDTSTLISGAKTDDASCPEGFGIGAGYGFYDGYCSEFIFWPTDLGDAGRDAARDDMNAYWEIY